MPKADPLRPVEILQDPLRPGGAAARYQLRPLAAREALETRCPPPGNPTPKQGKSIWPVTSVM